MSNKFLNTSGGNANLSDGSVTIYAASIGANDLTASKPLKTNSLKQLISTNLEITDVNNLRSELDSIGGGTVYDKSTGLISGGLITIGTSPNMITIAAGTGELVDTATNSIVTRTWVTTPDIVLHNIAFSNGTYVGIVANAVVVQPTPFTSLERQTTIVLGVVAHVDRATINGIDTSVILKTTPMEQVIDLMAAIGLINTDGNVYTGNAGLLTLNKSSGKIFSHGVNYANLGNPALKATGPNEVAVTGILTAPFIYAFQDTTTGPFRTTIRPDVYDTGTSPGSPVSNNYWTIQRVFMFAGGQTILQHGQAEYFDSDSALQGIHTEQFIISANIKTNAVLRSLIIVQQGSLNLDNALFINVDKFGQATSGGAGGGGAYLPLNGSEVMTGGLNMGVNSITGVNAITLEDGKMIIDNKTATGFGTCMVVTNGGIQTSGTMIDLNGTTGQIAMDVVQGDVKITNGQIICNNNVIFGEKMNIQAGGVNNTVIGRTNVSRIMTTGSDNTVIGNTTGYSISTGSNNTVIGSYANVNSSNSLRRIVIGHNAVNTADNTCIIGGTDAITGLTSISSGYDQNTDLGTSSLRFKDIFLSDTLKFKNNTGNALINSYTSTPILTGNYNHCFGGGGLLSSGSYNTFIGSDAGGENATGNNNTCIGYGAYTESNSTNRITIGSQSENYIDNTCVIGGGTSQNITSIASGKGSYTDLGSSSKPFKDLYISGSVIGGGGGGGGSTSYSGLNTATSLTNLDVNLAQTGYGKKITYTAGGTILVGQPCRVEHTGNLVVAYGIDAAHNSYDVIGIALAPATVGQNVEILTNGYCSAKWLSDFTVPEVILTSGNSGGTLDMSINAQNVKFLDSGGTGGQYDDNENLNYTFDAGVGETLELDVISFETEGSNTTATDRFGIQVSNDGISYINANVSWLKKTSDVDVGANAWNSTISDQTGGWLWPATLAESTLGSLPATITTAYRFIKFYFYSDSSVTKSGWNINILSTGATSGISNPVALNVPLYTSDTDKVQITSGTKLIGYSAGTLTTHNSVYIRLTL
jgi:hypothetical protein